MSWICVLVLPSRMGFLKTGVILASFLMCFSCARHGHNRNDRLLTTKFADKADSTADLSVGEGQIFIDAVVTAQVSIGQSRDSEIDNSELQYMTEYEEKFFDNLNRFTRRCILDFQLLNVPSAPKMRDHTAFSLDIIARAQNQADTDVSTLGSTSVNLFYIPNEFNAQFDRGIGSSSYQKIHVLHAKIDSFVRQVQAKSSNCK